MNDIWIDRGEPPHNPVFHLDRKCTGLDTFEKIELVAAKLGNDADCLLITDMESVGWMLNLHGSVFLGHANFHVFAILDVANRAVELFSHEGHFSREIKKYLTINNVTL